MEKPPSKYWPHRLAFSLIATLLLLIMVMVPFTVGSVVDELLGPPEGRVFRIPEASVPAAPTHSRLHIAIAALDEFQQIATLRISGHHLCVDACTWSDRVLFFAIAPYESDTEGAPPSASIVLPPDRIDVTQTVQLPMHGQPTRYPFDTYELQLGVAMERVYPDGRRQPFTVTDARGHLFLSLQEQVPRQMMNPPVPVDPHSVQEEGNPYEYVYVVMISLARPLWLRVLGILLVLLIAAAAAYAVFMRPLHELVLNSGALVLGVWGIRGILTNSNYPGLTAVDLALSTVILFLLGAITVRALFYTHERAELHLLRRRPK